MIKIAEKMIVVPIDGSENALMSLDYINRIFGPGHNLRLSLVYLLPKLPSILIEESSKSRETVNQLQQIDKKSSQMAERILAEAKDRLMQVGFTAKAVKCMFQSILLWCENCSGASVLHSSWGQFSPVSRCKPIT